MIQSDTGDRPVIGGFDRLCKMSLAIDASSLARIIISSKFKSLLLYIWGGDVNDRTVYSEEKIARGDLSIR